MLHSARLCGREIAVMQQLTCAYKLQVHAEDEVEHAAIGHEAVMAFVPQEQRAVLERAMLDHDRDFAVFYNGIAEMLE